MRVLVCEDDDGVARGLSRALTREGYKVARAAGVVEAMERIDEQVPEIALVDMTLPDGHGAEVVRRLRQHPSTAILIVTARGEERDRVIGLRAGADDYVVKPFSLAELMARIEAVARRTRQLRRVLPPGGLPDLHAGALVIDPVGRRVRHEHDETVDIALTAKECQILVILAEQRDSVVTREHLLDQVWGSVSPLNSRTLDTHMAALRAKLGELARVATVRGVGYRFDEAG
ncbi:response regulator transcription factor [Micromonospora zingiberis]|uniref:Response regulator transcription factor n=1 Tax=Micromonospora zingiberis TaxID=2053011 RepID=A0A4R0GSD6_9ACTN|nr:response regulator transcription factor [Micromonospora zingiberis]TCB98448.1 response regulator transcription factor [Micromonospora zingiberis]